MRLQFTPRFSCGDGRVDGRAVRWRKVGIPVALLGDEKIFFQIV